MEINDKEIADWVNDCPTHKIEVLYSDENGIQLLVNFNNEKEIDIDNEIEKRYEKFYEWLDTCPFKWTESGHPTSGMTSVNFEIEEG